MLSSVNKETGELSQVAGRQATADKIFYDNSETGIPASNVQEAIDKSTRIFYGTRAEWNELTTEEKVVYEYAAFEDDDAFPSTVNWLEGKTINFLGDSITWGHVAGQQMERPFPSIVGKRLRCTANNYGVSGSTLVGSSAPYSYQPFVDRMTSMDKSAAMNVVMGGTNDYGHSDILLGNLSDTGSSTIYGALKTIAEYLLENFPNATNVFCAPIRYGASYNNGRYAMEELVYAVKSVAKKYGFVFIDTYHNLPGWMPSNATALARYGVNGVDQVHPNQKFNDEIFGPYMSTSLLRMDGGNIVSPKDPHYCREILNMENYYGGAWFSGAISGYIDEGILYCNFTGQKIHAAGGGAFTIEGQGWNNAEYKPSQDLASFVGGWEPVYGLDGKPIMVWFTGNGSNSWSWNPGSISETIPSALTYQSFELPLDR